MESLEPAQAPIEAIADYPDPETVYKIKTKVQKLTRSLNSRAELVWFVQFEGSSESISLGNDMPLWSIGDHIIITLERTFADFIPASIK